MVPWMLIEWPTLAGAPAIEMASKGPEPALRTATLDPPGPVAIPVVSPAALIASAPLLPDGKGEARSWIVKPADKSDDTRTISGSASRQ